MAITVFDHLPEANKENSFQQTAFLIQQCIDHHSLDDAVFLAEMLHERVGSDDSLLQLCDCLLRLSRTDEVYHLLQRHPKNSARLRYLYAKCCFDLKKFDECERALVDNRVHPAQLHSIFDDTLSAPFAGNLLAMVFCQTGRVDLSRTECSHAIRGNPFIWSAVRKYVQVGGEQTKELMKQLDLTAISLPKKSTKPEKTMLTKRTPLNTRVIAPPKPVAPKKTRAVERTQQQSGITEARRSLRLYNQDTENAGSRGALTRGQTPRLGKNQGVRSSAKVIELPATALPPRRSREAKPLQSRSANALRSLSSSTTSVASTASHSAETVKDSDSMMDETEKPLEPLLKDIYESVQLLAEIEEFIGSHQWLKATDFIAALPLNVSRQSLALLLRGRVLFELSNYEAAKDVLQQLKRQHPHKVEGMELLSTALWQLQDAEGLSTLAQELTECHRRRPQTWCVVGNCFSLQRQHSLAVDCMERAVQLDPQFAYAYTLLGHELVYQEELERAGKAFRAALNISPNDYRAWYGLGQVHQRSEQLHLAQANMKRAVEINPRNMGILVSLAQVEQALGHLEQAMILLTRALELNPNDVAVRYNRARLLYDMRKEEECLEELNRLKELSPDEAHIFHLLGKVHRRLENTHKALLNYSWATEMDPRGEQMQAHGLVNNFSGDDSQSPGEEDEEDD